MRYNSARAQGKTGINLAKKEDTGWKIQLFSMVFCDEKQMVTLIAFDGDIAMRCHRTGKYRPEIMEKLW